MPQIIAHRGNSAACPENTRAAFQQALEDGADGLELDLQLTADNQVVVYHDDNLGKAGWPDQKIHDLTREELNALEVGSWFKSEFSGSLIPQLEDVLDEFSSLTLLLEWKASAAPELSDLDRRLADRTLEILGALNTPWDGYILCFNLSLLEYAHEQAPGLPCAWNIESPVKLPAVAQDRFPDAYSINVDHLSVPFASKVHKRNAPVMTWTCNTEEQVRKALKADADFIMANDPVQLQDLVERLT